MSEIRSSPTRPTSAADATSSRDTSVASRVKHDCLSFLVSLREGFQYFKASVIGQGKKLTAKNEKEAMNADLRAEKMQVEAADEAEEAKAKIHKSS